MDTDELQASTDQEPDDDDDVALPLPQASAAETDGAGACENSAQLHTALSNSHLILPLTDSVRCRFRVNLGKDPAATFAGRSLVDLPSFSLYPCPPRPPELVHKLSLVPNTTPCDPPCSMLLV